MTWRLLDLFCGAGGASMGYTRAGFDVTGVDVKPQPRYPFTFVQADAMTYPLAGFDVIHASPPCQDHSPLWSVAGIHGTGWMLDAILTRLAGQPAPWIVENVGAAHNRADFLLCGEMFDLRTIRHRRFTVDPRVPGLLSVPEHRPHQRPTSTKDRVAALAEGHNLSVTGDVGRHAGPPCLGIDWMTGDELSQAIPPAYTEFVGRWLLAELEGRRDGRGLGDVARAERAGLCPEDQGEPAGHTAGSEPDRARRTDGPGRRAVPTRGLLAASTSREGR